MNNFSKNFAWAILTLIVISLVFSFFMEPTTKPEKLTLAQVAEKMTAGEVKKISVQGDKFNLILQDDKQAYAEKESGIDATVTLRNLGVSEENMRKAGYSVESESGWNMWAGILIPTLLPLIIIGAMFWFMFRQAKSGANQAFSFGRSNIRLSMGGKQKVTFDDVAGLKEAKEELKEIVEFLRSPKKFFDIGARIPRGVLLAGLPGTGKTLLARAVAGESNVPFFSVSASEFVEMFVGVGASRIRDAFATARKAAPSILFIDEIDAVGRQRGAGMGGGNDEREQTLNQILVELDGFEQGTRVIVLAATNRPDVLDPALLRPGRFDRRVVLDLPDINEREAILKVHAKGKTLDKNIDFKKIATRTPGFSGADLANLMNEGAILAARGNKKSIGQDDILESVEKVLLGPERRTLAISTKEKEITAYHEGGHALVAAGLKDFDPIHKISIISRGFAGGYTMKLPNEERRLRTKTQFINEIAMSLGGYIAEKLTFGDITTGASSDLKQASEIARKLVTKYGMSELGPITFGSTEELVFLGREIGHERNYSEKVAGQIDEEVAKIVERAYAVADKILKQNKKALKKIADVLIEKEVLEQEEFYALLKPFEIKAVVA
ncbi:MAG: ATP-dependent zinc metalloprotease FtsH [Candidatus Liptonbacteria bacterium]